MTTVEHTITLTGSAFEGRGYKPEASAFFWNNLERSVCDAARITVYGASRRIGRPIKQLSDAWNLRIEDRGPDASAGGRTFLALLPAVGDAVPQLFEQKSLFGDDLNPDDTVLDWLGDVTTAVWDGRRDSAKIDADLLEQLAKYKSSGKHGLESAKILTRRFSAGQVRVNEELAAKAETLVSATPPPKRARIKGVLNTIAYLDRGVLLSLEGGERLRVLWSPEDLEPLRELWGQDVLLEGLLQYKANGQPQILVADAIRASSAQDQTWKDLPSPLHLKQADVAKRAVFSGVNPLAKLRGVLDGVVGDDEFGALVEAAS